MLLEDKERLQLQAETAAEPVVVEWDRADAQLKVMNHLEVNGNTHKGQFIYPRHQYILANNRHDGYQVLFAISLVNSKLKISILKDPELGHRYISVDWSRFSKD